MRLIVATAVACIAFGFIVDTYGNGFAAGMVAAVVSPIALMFVDRRESDRRQEPEAVPST